VDAVRRVRVDNIFVFLMLFTFFGVPPAFQKRVLMIGAKMLLIDAYKVPVAWSLGMTSRCWPQRWCCR
jgi:hypothetical protein